MNWKQKYRLFFTGLICFFTGILIAKFFIKPMVKKDIILEFDKPIRELSISVPFIPPEKRDG